jgi:hypothetical protein
MSDYDFAKHFQIMSACTEDWDSMIGNDQIRFCSHCRLSVHDLTQMNRKRIKRLIARSNGRLCVRYSKLIPPSTPPALKTLYKIGRRTSVIAASAFSASLSISSAIAGTVNSKQDSGSFPMASVSAAYLDQQASQGGTGSLQGIVFDPNGTVISGAMVSLTHAEKHEVVVVYSDGRGNYKFDNLPAGTYQLKIDAGGFLPNEVPNIVVRASDNNRLDQTLSISSVSDPNEVGGEIRVMGGAMAISASDPLVKAAQDDDIEAVKEALKKIDANARDTNTQWNALEYAVRNGNREMVQLLLWAKADVTARDRNGQTVLMMIDESATSDIIWDLVNAGAKVNARDDDGDTPLSETAIVNNTEALKTLLDAGAKVNAVNNEGQSALMKAAEEGLVNNIRILIQAGADLNHRDKEGKTALMYAKEGDHRAAVRLLISMGAIEFVQKEKK